MGKLVSDVTIGKLAEIARDVTVAAINNAAGGIGAGGRTTMDDLGAAAGRMYALALQEIIKTEY